MSIIAYKNDFRTQDEYKKEIVEAWCHYILYLENRYDEIFLYLYFYPHILYINVNYKYIKYT